MQLSRSTPIVIPGVSDPVGVGWAESLARPGGNVTGFTNLELSMFGKMLETLREIAPAATRVAFIYHPDNSSAVFFQRAFKAAAGLLAIEPLVVPIHGLADIEQCMASLAEQQNAAVLFPPDLTTQALRGEVVALAARHRLPAIYTDAMFVRLLAVAMGGFALGNLLAALEPGYAGLLAARLLLALSAASFMPTASGYAAALGGPERRGRAHHHRRAAGRAGGGRASAGAPASSVWRGWQRSRC
jgi:ABC transporter substrate binding protein